MKQVNADALGTEIKPISYTWHRLFQEHCIPLDGIIIEVAPGYETKIGDALALLGFQGTIILIEPDEAAAAHIKEAYQRIMPQATVSVVAKCLQDVEMGKDIPLWADALVANHPFDDMAIAFAMHGTHVSFFSQEREDGIDLTPCIQQLYDAIDNKDYIHGILATIVVWKDVIQKLKPALFIASQYPSHKLAMKKLTKRQNSGFIIIELLRDYYERYITEQYQSKSFGQQGDPAWWIIAHKPYIDFVSDLAEKPAAMERLGESVFVVQQARRLDPASYDVVYVDSHYFQDSGYGGDALSHAHHFAVKLDNDNRDATRAIAVYADRQKDSTDISLGGNLGSGRAVYYGKKYHVMGVGKTTLCKNTVPSHSTGSIHLLEALRRVVVSRWINYFTKKALKHPVVIARKETVQSKWSPHPVPLALLVRVDDGMLDRPSHVEYSPLIAVDFQETLTGYARLDAQYFAYRIMLGAWSTGNYSLMGNMIDLETASFVKYRGPYTTASAKYHQDFFGYEGLGFVRILQQLADVKGITDADIERKFYAQRRQYMAQYFLSLLGIDEVHVSIFFSLHADQVMALSD